MKIHSYDRIYKSQEYLSSLGTIHFRSLFGSYSLTIRNTVFAMVANGELYLRACEQSVQYCVQHSPVWLTFLKRGRPVMLNYYQVDDTLWRDQQQLIQLSKFSLDAALQEKLSRSSQQRLKDLPNMTFHLESLLNEAGIYDVATLRMLGAKMCWLRLRQTNKSITDKVLFNLEGAIYGIHEAALPAIRRQELALWVKSLSPVPMSVEKSE